MTPVHASASTTAPNTPAALLGAAVAAALVLASVDAFAFAHGAQGARDALGSAVYLAAAAAAWKAACAFHPGDHMRRAWRLMAVPPALVVPLTLMPGGPQPEPFRWAAAVVTVVASACGVVAMVQFAVTLRQAGLLLPGSARQRVGATVVLLVASLLAVGPDAAAMARLAVQGNVEAGAALVADLCDLALVMLFVPVFFTARAFVGGSLGWPFAFLACCELTWLAFDGFQTYRDSLGLSPVAVELLDTLLHVLAPLFVVAAACAQRLALRRVPAGAGPA